MCWLRRIAIGMAGLLGFIGGVGVLLIALFLFAPEVLVNERSIRYGLRLAYGPDLLNWSELAVQVDSPTLSSKEIDLRVAGLQLSLPNMAATASRAAVGLRLQLDPRKPLMERLGPLTIEKLQVEGDLRSPAEDRPPLQPSEASPSQRAADGLALINRLLGYNFASLHVAAESFRFETEQGLISGKAEASYEPRGETEAKILKLALAELTGLSLRRLDAALLVRAKQEALGGAASQIELKARANLVTGDELRADLTATPYTNSREWDLKGSLQFKEGKTSMNANVDGTIRQRDARALLSIKLEGGLPYFRSLAVPRCQLRADWGESWVDDVTVGLDCRGSATRMQTIDEKLIASFVPLTFRFDVAGQAKLQGAAKKKVLTTTAELQLAPIRTTVASLHGSASLEGRLPLAAPERAALATRYSFDARVLDFRQLVANLDGTRLAIPAPLNQLAGEVNCRSAGAIDVSRREGRIPLHCDVDLKAPEQSVVLAADGAIAVHSRARHIEPVVDLVVGVESFDFVLPELELGKGMPAVVTDKRIVKADAPAQQVSPVHLRYDIALRSLHKNAVRLHTNLASQAIPLTIAARLRSGKPTEGTVSVEKFGVELLRRKIQVDHLLIKLADEPNNREITGVLEFKDNIYQIFLRIYGTMADPVYVFESKPPLPERDILAILLFGHKPESLDIDKMQSVEDTRAAIADGAINLLSMYYLAATPVESIGYNSQSQMFTANIRLREGLSMSIGTDTDERSQLGLRKRVGRNMTIETRVIHDEATNANRGQAMLKWGVRY